jgi:hypothetical protein
MSVHQIPAFGTLTRRGWAATILVTVLSELSPVPVVHPILHYSVKAAKVLLFLFAGYLLPLAFWRFHTLKRGVLVAAISAGCVESLQGVIGHGHSFHWYELVVKWALMLFGFGLGLEARYEGLAILGPLKVVLVGDPRRST